MKIKILIVEDEILAGNELLNMLRELRPDKFELMAQIGDVDSAVKFLLSNKPDLIFMDIHLGDGNSFSIFDQVDIESPIIFTTAYDQFALQAFKQNSIDYLLKPIDIDDLEKSIEKFEKQTSISNPDLNQFIKQINYKARFMVSKADRIVAVEVQDVAYFMAEGKALYMFTNDGERYLLEGSLSALEKRLDPKKFFKANRKFIIGFKAIKEMFYYSKSRIKINLYPEYNDIKDTLVSAERCGEFKKWLNGE
ncbi:MAG: LytTR family DNA-binding domain-containing protein [Marinifilaceae bacterium]|jgi:DNA-binding LytR/AlgR family response regulator|nr:LytTR family DNA-binding domain-containing protein [Marinifilaceae bacterium]